MPSNDDDLPIEAEWTWLVTDRLHRAAQDGDLALIDELLREGCAVDAFDEDLPNTPLHYAAMNGHGEAMRRLIKAGANVNAHDYDRAGDTPLGKVADTCTFEIASLLIEAGADPTIPGWMALTAVDRSARRQDVDGPRVHDLLRTAATKLRPGWEFDGCRWLNEPREWRLGSDGLVVTTDAGTDFWRETHYGFIRHSGHFFGRKTAGDFTASLRVRAQYETLYDQAGIMVLVDEAHWIKAGIELSDGAALLGSVLTEGRSDWATGPWRGDPADLWLRVTVANGALRLQASADGKIWPLVRLCPFPAAQSYRVGPMCCTPERAGLRVLFSDFTVGPPSGKDLHDLS